MRMVRLRGHMNPLNRREFVRLAGAASCGIAAKPACSAEAAQFPVAFFEKPFQFLNYRELGEVLGEIGFDGIEATVRKGGILNRPGRWMSYLLASKT